MHNFPGRDSLNSVLLVTNIERSVLTLSDDLLLLWEAFVPLSPKWITFQKSTSCRGIRVLLSRPPQLDVVVWSIAGLIVLKVVGILFPVVCTKIGSIILSKQGGCLSRFVVNRMNGPVPSTSCQQLRLRETFLLRHINRQMGSGCDNFFSSLIKYPHLNIRGAYFLIKLFNCELW